MRYPKKIGTILLCVWLILYGLGVLLKLSFEGMPIIMAIVAIAAGVLIFIDQ
jgi:hypothetical protein